MATDKVSAVRRGGRKEKQVRLVKVERVRDPVRSNFNKDRVKLHELYKRLKAGLVRVEDVEADDVVLLKKYYGMR